MQEPKKILQELRKDKDKDNIAGAKSKDNIAGAGAIDPTDPAAAAASKLQPNQI